MHACDYVICVNASEPMIMIKIIVWVLRENVSSTQSAASMHISSVFTSSMQQTSFKHLSCNQDQASMELSLQSTGCSIVSIECSDSTNSCSELVIGLQNSTKVYTCTVAQRFVSSPMQVQATQLITSANYRFELVIGLQNCIQLVRCTKVVQEETDCTASGAMTLAKRDIMIHR